MDELTEFSFGYWVRRRRLALDLTQAELGRRAGVSAAAIRKIEADERRPSCELAELLASALGVPAEERAAFLAAARGLASIERLPVAVGPLAAPAQPIPPATPHNLPAPLTSFVNRTSDVAAVTALLRRPDVRLLTLVGPPGVGKTRLSIHAAEALLPAFPDGVWFVELAPISDPALALAAIARQAGVSKRADEPLAQRFRAALGGKRVLLVLDNCEQVVEVAAEVSELLRACKGLKVLATSRVPLHVYGEHEYAASPLSLPPPGALPDQMLEFEAVQLFVACTRQHQPAFAVDAANAGDVADILRKLEGIPLAIELAAVALRRLSVAGLAAMLCCEANWVDAIQATARDLPPRQRTLASAIAWSYDLLDADSQRCLRRLAVLVGPFTLDAAVAICTETADPADRARAQAWLTALADHSLLSPEPGRWRLLEMVREFAWNRLDPQERDLAQRRHADYFRNLLAQSASDMAAIERDHNNYLAALRWFIERGEASAALRMCADLAWFWETHGYVHEGQALIRRSLALGGEVAVEQRIGLLFKAANLSWQRHDFASADEFAGQAIAIAEDERPEELAALFNLVGRMEIERGEFAQAEAALRRSAALARQRPELLNPGFPLLQLGEVAWARGDLTQAQALFDEAAALLPDAGPELARAILHTDRAEIALARGDVVAARGELLLALPHVRQHVRRVRFWLVSLAGWLLADGSPEDAALAVQCLAAEEGLGERGGPLSPIYHALIAQRRRTACDLVEAATWSALWRAARVWTAQEALARAESWLGR
ncbi:ATP-binding protein [Chloroflexus aggregans]|uniref:Transcriptional regulator, XRE family n=1 Tax=Chloroflexus aggregans (strain MD-66 / DSM 9485) TaxID=326427 RepID=B8G4Y3_CHLAD|nr:helix-turn-helix domain-containing protein [Chloroflexus aggregans]ACL23616.1 transcriptional regulator, XRE family [Chloroflexus aggregans DSM 9485]